jgi:hypothetical protein
VLLCVDMQIAATDTSLHEGELVEYISDSCY